MVVKWVFRLFLESKGTPFLVVLKETKRTTDAMFGAGGSPPENGTQQTNPICLVLENGPVQGPCVAEVGQPMGWDSICLAAGHCAKRVTAARPKFAGHLSRNPNLVQIYGRDRPLLTFIYPGFDCGSFKDLDLEKQTSRQRRRRVGKSSSSLPGVGGGPHLGLHGSESFQAPHEDWKSANQKPRQAAYVQEKRGGTQKKRVVFLCVCVCLCLMVTLSQIV